MAITKRDLEDLADSLASVRPSDPANHRQSYRQWNDCVTKVADVCGRSNPRFKREKFYEACETRKTYV